MSSVTYRNQEELCRFLSGFLPKKRLESDVQDENAKEYPEEAMSGFPLQKSCFYCGEAVDATLAEVRNFHGAVCLNCKREILWKKEQFQQLVEETVHNVQYMFAISWDKSVRVQTRSFLKICSPDKEKGGSEKKNTPFWENSMAPEIMQFRMDDKEHICDCRIRTNVPAGAVTAVMVHTVIQNYLRSFPEENGLPGEWIPGLSAWYMVHYLYCMDHERYGNYYDKYIKTCLLKADRFYQKLRAEQDPKSQWIVSLDQGLRMAQLNGSQPNQD